jgi:hypothetical protein
MTEALDTLTPREIDTRLADLHTASQKAAQDFLQALARVHWAAGDRQQYHGRRQVWTMTPDEAEAGAKQVAADDSVRVWTRREAEEALDALQAAREEQERIREQCRPLNEEWDRRKWSRFFLVTSSNGHIHSSMDCSTCNLRTTFGWLPEVSGKSEKEAVEEHGPRLCSVCFPSAPVEWTVGEERIEEGVCEGSGRYVPGVDMRMYSKYGKCEVCGQQVSVTSRGNARKHKGA